jgi:hypothetical protein
VLVVSAFFPVRFFGLLVAISVLKALIGALVVLPAMALVLRPHFLGGSGFGGSGLGGSGLGGKWIEEAEAK